MGCHARGGGLFALPDPRCSPGATNPDVTQANIGSTICHAGWTTTIRPPESVTQPEKLVGMRAYGIAGSPHDYEWDHVIALSSGGAPNSYANFFPELDYPGVSGKSFVLNPKDRLEDLFHRLICSHRLSLVAAQEMEAEDWATAYRHYVKIR